MLKKLINAATDCSDGLIIDLDNIARESKVSYDLFKESIPHSKEAKEFLAKNKHLSNKINNWGEDYELIFTAPQYNREKLLT